MYKKASLYSLISLFAIGGLYVQTAHAATGNGIQIPTTVNGITYQHKIVAYNANSGTYEVLVFNSGATTCTAVSTCSTDWSTLDYVGNGNTAVGGRADAAFLQGTSGSQGVDNALAYNCTDLSTDCNYPSGGNSGSTFGDHRIDWFGTYGGGDYSLIFTDVALKDWNNGGANDAAPTVVNTSTRIISMSPEEGTTTGNTVQFALHAYINPDDVGNIVKINIEFRNIDQNVFLAGGFSPSSFTVFFGNATTTGDWYIATTTVLGDGNYRVTATLNTCISAFGACLVNTNIPFTDIGVSVEESHQFIVNQETFIGHISQQSFRELQAITASSSATSTAALARTCNPLGGTFDTFSCMSFLFIPDAGNLVDSLNSFKNGFLIRVPWGYLTRFVTILSSSATTTLPSISYTFDSNSPLHGDTWNIDTNAMVAGGGVLLDSVENVDSHRSLKDVFYSMVQLVVGLAVIFQIVHDLTGSHSHVAGEGGKQKV